MSIYDGPPTDLSDTIESDIDFGGGGGGADLTNWLGKPFEEGGEGLYPFWFIAPWADTRTDNDGAVPTLSVQWKESYGDVEGSNALTTYFNIDDTSNGEGYTKTQVTGGPGFTRTSMMEVGSESDGYTNGFFAQIFSQVDALGEVGSSVIKVVGYSSGEVSLNLEQDKAYLNIHAVTGQTDPIFNLKDENGASVFRVYPDSSIYGGTNPGSYLSFNQSDLYLQAPAGGGAYVELAAYDVQAFLFMKAAPDQAVPTVSLSDENGQARVTISTPLNHTEISVFNAAGAPVGGIQSWDAGGSAGDYVSVVANGAAPIFLDGGIGTYIGAKHSAPTDAVLSDLNGYGLGEGVFTAWIDQATNKLKFRVLYGDGTTFKTGEVSLA